MIRSFCMYMYVFVQPLLYLTRCILQRGVFVSVYSYTGVWRYHLFDKRDKSLRFSCIRKLVLLIADFGGLVGRKNM